MSEKDEMMEAVLELLTDCQSCGLRPDMDLEDMRVLRLFAGALESADVTAADVARASPKIIASSRFFPRPFDIIEIIRSCQGRHVLTKEQLDEIERLNA